MRSRVVVTFLILGVVASPAASARDDDVVDRLHHPKGTVTGPAGIAHVERRGDGPIPMLLLAGAPYGWKVWEQFMERNASRYTMWAVTPAGYDATPPPAMPEDEDYAAQPWTNALLGDLATLIEKEMAGAGKLGPPVVVGHHLASDYYAVRLARDRPELVKAIVTVAGQGTIPIGSGPVIEDLDARAKYVRDDRAPFFRSVSQETWNANTFPAKSLSNDEARGHAWFEAEVAVPIETQVRYYLEATTDGIEPHVTAIVAPLLAIEVQPRMTFENLPSGMKSQLEKQFGSLEAAKQAVRFGGPWEALVEKAPDGLARIVHVAKSGAMLMDDAAEEFDDAVAKFIAELDD
ncbi:MAG: alpha/beta hydrolase [Planctomycetes bacterium]|nr:alpha/beta hydrolase [Planctomycetota bacterium]